MLKIDLTKTGAMLKKGCNVLVPVLMGLRFTGMDKQILKAIRYSGNVKYDDAIRVITESNMLGSSMAEAMDLVQSNMSCEYYRSVISAINSNTLGSTKIMMLKNINKNFEKKEEESQ